MQGNCSHPDLDLATAEPGTFALTHSPEMLEALQRDYVAMQGMIFGDPPSFDAILQSVRGLEAELNAAG